MSGSTPNYHFPLPTIGGDASSWGSELNTGLGQIDAVVKTVETNLTNVGNYVDQNGLYARRGPDGGAYATVSFYDQTATFLRWDLYEDATTESGGNAGSNFGLNAFDDGGNYLGYAFTINRASQRITLGQNPVSAMDAATKQYVDASVSAAAPVGLAPIGSIVMWASNTPPPNWVFCNGGVYPISVAPALFAVIGASYGGNGTTNFAVPNLGGRMPVGSDGGASWPMAATGGETAHTLVTGEMPVHTHGVTDPQHSHSGIIRPTGGPTQGQVGSVAYSPALTDPAATNISIQNAGGGAAHNNMPPYQVVGFIIRYQ